MSNFLTFVTPAYFLQSLLAVVSIAFSFRLYIAPENHRAETDCNR